MITDFVPAGDQPLAISDLVDLVKGLDEDKGRIFILDNSILVSGCV